LIDAVRAIGSREAQPMLEHLMAATDRFVAGAKQHDDMTLVVVRVEAAPPGGSSA